MFMHPDGDETVEAPTLLDDVAMVALDQSNLLAHSMPAETLAHIVILVPHGIIDGDVDMVSLRHVDRHVAPAGADLEYLHAGLQTKLSADVFIVVEFGLVERFRVGRP